MQRNNTIYWPVFVDDLKMVNDEEAGLLWNKINACNHIA